MRPYDLYKERRLFLLYLTLGGGGGGGGDVIETTVTGISPLALVNAVADELVSLTRTGKVEHAPKTYVDSLTQYGKVIQNGTPTPETPVDLVCNNGVLRMVHRSGLPSGYKLLEYVGGSGSQYVITDLYLASTDVVECEFRNSATTGYGAVYGVFKLGESSALYGNQTYYGYDKSNNKVDTDIRVDTEWHSSRHDFINGTLTIDDTTVAFTPFEFVNSTKNAVLSRYYNNSYGYNWKGYVRKFKVTRNGEVVCDLLPAKNSNDVAGLYDLVSGSFYTATGGDLLEGNEVDDYELQVVGTPEVLTVLQNLLTRDGETTGKIINADGTVSENANYCISAPFTLSAGNYVCTWNFGHAGTRPFSVFACDADGTPKTDGRIFYQPRSEAGINTGEFTIEAEMLVVSSYRINVTDLTIYRNAQTASVSNLYAVGDYKDEQDIISGVVNRKVGVKVLDGTEDWFAPSTPSLYGLAVADGTLTKNKLVVSTHYAGTTALNADMEDCTAKATHESILAPGKISIYVKDTSCATLADFKAKLAAEKVAGTPVIVLYPLAEETTESVTPQPIYNFTPDLNVYAAASVALTDSDFAKTSSSHTEPTPYAPLDLICNNGKIGESGAAGPKEVVTVSPYGSTAVIEDLFAVGEYADTHEVVSGSVNRKVGVKVLDGTETWGQKNATDGRIIMRLNDAINQASAPIIVTHGQWSASAVKDSDEWRILAGPYLCCYSSLETTADFKAYLAKQYANGTPVIVIYPLAEEVTTSVVNQDIELVDGMNTITTNSAVSDAPISAVYKMRSS